jgi:hypothetical protein
MRVPTPYSKSNEIPGQLRVLTLAYYQVLQFHLTNDTPIGNDRLGRPGTTLYIAQVMHICLV